MLDKMSEFNRCFYKLPNFLVVLARKHYLDKTVETLLCLISWSGRFPFAEMLPRVVDHIAK